MAAMAVVMAAFGLIAAGPTQAASTTIHGCPRGAVCIYPQGAGWNGDRPSYEFWSYGAHNLSNQYGYHYVFNNQYDYTDSGGWISAAAGGMTGYNGTGTMNWSLVNYIHQSAGNPSWRNLNLTPINSILLYVAGP